MTFVPGEHMHLNPSCWRQAWHEVYPHLAGLACNDIVMCIHVRTLTGAGLAHVAAHSHPADAEMANAQRDPCYLPQHRGGPHPPFAPPPGLTHLQLSLGPEVTPEAIASLTRLSSLQVNLQRVLRVFIVDWKPELAHASFSKSFQQSSSRREAAAGFLHGLKASA